jgi:hypothetical protein
MRLQDALRHTLKRDSIFITSALAPFSSSYVPRGNSARANVPTGWRRTVLAQSDAQGDAARASGTDLRTGRAEGI